MGIEKRWKHFFKNIYIFIEMIPCIIVNNYIKDTLKAVLTKASVTTLEILKYLYMGAPPPQESIRRGGRGSLPHPLTPLRVATCQLGIHRDSSLGKGGGRSSCMALGSDKSPWK